jgi:hypothetical protein
MIKTHLFHHFRGREAELVEPVVVFDALQQFDLPPEKPVAPVVDVFDVGV